MKAFRIPVLGPNSLKLVRVLELYETAAWIAAKPIGELSKQCGKITLME
jgi:hypothetical protein